MMFRLEENFWPSTFGHLLDIFPINCNCKEFINSPHVLQVSMFLRIKLKITFEGERREALELILIAQIKNLYCRVC